MSFDYERDDANSRIVVTYAGEVPKAHGPATLSRHRLENVGDYGILYDFRRLTGDATVAELRAFIKEDAILPSGPAHGPVAFVASDPLIYSLACAFAALNRPTRAIEVFRKRHEAERWMVALTDSCPTKE